MTTKNDPAGDQAGGTSDDATAAKPHASAAMLRREYDAQRRPTLRRTAQRQLDELLNGGPTPLALGDPIDWHACHLDLGVPERDALGRELAVARG